MKKILAFLLIAVLILTCACAEGKKVRVGISWIADPEDGVMNEDAQAFIDAVAIAGGDPVYFPLFATEEEVLAALETVDCVVLTGGEDIDPALYGEAPDAMLEDVNKARDTSDTLLLKATMAAKKPLLAVCRGFQLVNVTLGGTLYQDLPTMFETDVEHRSADLIDFAYHTITVADENTLVAKAMGGAGEYEVNSWHHQGVKDVAEGLVVTATAPNGLVEALEIADADYYFLAVQFHPEWHVVEGWESFTAFFTQLMDAAA